MILLPCAARSRITRSASALSGTFSTKVVLTLSPNSASTALRPWSCAKVQPASPTGPMYTQAAFSGSADGRGSRGRSGCRRRGLGRGFFLLAAADQRGQRCGGRPAEQAAFGQGAHATESPLGVGECDLDNESSSRLRDPLQRSNDYVPGWKGFPSDAGMLMRIHVGLRLMMASTTMVAMYGSIASNWLEKLTPAPCSANCAIVTPPNR